MTLLHGTGCACRPAADPCQDKGGNRYPVWFSQIHALTGSQSPAEQSSSQSTYWRVNVLDYGLLWSGALPFLQLDKEVQNLIDWVCLSEQIKENNNTIRNLTGEYKKIEPNCREGVRHSWRAKE